MNIVNFLSSIFDQHHFVHWRPTKLFLFIVLRSTSFVHRLPINIFCSLTSEQHFLFIDFRATSFVHWLPSNIFCSLTSEQHLLFIDLQATVFVHWPPSSVFCSLTSEQHMFVHRRRTNIVVFIDPRPTIFVHRLPTNIVRPLTIILPSRLQWLVFFICNCFAKTYQHLVVIDNIAVVSFTSNERNHVF